ncbi:MAG: prepilin-type N-terminal cleavage/methylation domain-containing protein [Chthoniobacteraceae bacterium]
MNASFSQIKAPAQSYRAAFTLVELLVSMAVLVLMIASVAQMVSSATKVTTSMRSKMNADQQARNFFDHIATDLSRMPNRQDLDYYFGKTTGNDFLFFYSEAPAFDQTSAAPTVLNSLSLVGYQIQPKPGIDDAGGMDRLGMRLSWGQTSPGSANFLTPKTLTPYVDYTPNSSTTIKGAFGTYLNALSTAGTSTTNNYFHSIGDGIFRFEYCFQLTDGSFSEQPLLYSNPAVGSTTSSTPKYNSTSGTGPNGQSDSSAGFSIGSRWWDGTRGYICVDATVGQAVWVGAGMTDVSSIIVAIAVLDSTSQKVLASASNGLLSNANFVALAAPLVDITNANLQVNPTASQMPTLMAKLWNAKVLTPTNTWPTLPVAVTSQIRVYQRSIPLSKN